MFNEEQAENKLKYLDFLPRGTCHAETLFLAHCVHESPFPLAAAVFNRGKLFFPPLRPYEISRTTRWKSQTR